MENKNVIKLLINHNLTFEEYYILLFLKTDLKNCIEYINKLPNYYRKYIINKLQKKLYIVNENNIKLTKLGLSLIENNTNNVKNWIDEWYDLFPKGVTSGNKPIRSGKSGCLIKLEKFVKDSGFDREIIMKATKKYISDYKSKNWEYMQTAAYFINKNNISTLESYCEQVINSESLDVDIMLDNNIKSI